MILFCIIVFVVALCVFGCLWQKWKRLDKYNQNALSLQTFDGKQSPYHPSVLFFENGWRNWKYYMAETPFACTYPERGENYRDRFECPSIHVSNDGLHWLEINENPIDRLEREALLSYDYFSDPHLVYTGNAIECWYRITRRHGDYENHNDVSLIRKVTTDGVHWSEREVLLRLSDEHALGNMIISQSVLYQDGAYHIWYVDGIEGQRHIAYSHSADGKQWGKKQVCSLNGYAINPWHMDLSFIDGVYWLVVFDRIDLSLWSSFDGQNFNYVKSLLLPSKRIGSFYYKDLYRACLVKVGESYRLYFSANDTLKTSIGVMEGKTPDTLEMISVDGVINSGFKDFVLKNIRINTGLFIGKIKRLLYLYGKRPVVRLLNSCKKG